MSMRYLTVGECARFGAPGTQNEVQPVEVKDGNVLSFHIFTGHASGYREPRLRTTKDRVYGRLVAAIENGEV